MRNAKLQATIPAAAVAPEYSTGMMDEPTSRSFYPETCCCVFIQPRASLPQWMLLEDRSGVDASLLDRLLCHCGPKQRVHSGIEGVAEIKSLAGATLQRGEHSTGGSVQTLKWCSFDKEKRVAHLEVFGGVGGDLHSAQWTEPGDSCVWPVLMTIARCCDYSYRFKFSEDWRRADILIETNLCCVCCLPIPPCVPAWCTVPSSLVAFEMVQSDDSTDGSFWYRNSSTCGGPFKKSYDLVEVYKPDGKAHHKAHHTRPPHQTTTPDYHTGTPHQATISTTPDLAPLRATRVRLRCALHATTLLI